MLLNDTNFKEYRLSPHGSLTQETLVSKLQPKIDHRLSGLRQSHGRTAGEFLAICGIFHEEVAQALQVSTFNVRGLGLGASASAHTPLT